MPDGFGAAWAALPTSADEQLASRIVAVCAVAFLVSGVGISAAGPSAIRIPVGASSSMTSLAERLEFTAGAGPCLHAQATGLPVAATDELLAERWPALYQLLTRHTRFRSITSIPLIDGTTAVGTLDLYSAAGRFLSDVQLAQAVTVGARITEMMLAAGLVPVAAEPQRFLTSVPVSTRNWVYVAADQIRAGADLTAAEALQAMREKAKRAGRTVDDIASDIVTNRLRPSDLDRPRPRRSGGRHLHVVPD